MALIRKFERQSMERNTVHSEISATYTVFNKDGAQFIQIDSYGSESREIPGKKSQSFQLDKEAARSLYQILQTEFGF